MSFTKTYLKDCVSGRYSAWTRNRIAGAGDTYFDVDGGKLRVVTEEETPGFDFGDDRRVFIPTLDDLLSYLEFLLRSRGLDPDSTPISLTRGPDSRWTARIGSLDFGDREDVGVGKDSPHTARARAILQAVQAVHPGYGGCDSQ